MINKQNKIKDVITSADDVASLFALIPSPNMLEQLYTLRLLYFRNMAISLKSLL